MSKSANIQHTKQIEYTLAPSDSNKVRGNSPVNIPIAGNAAMEEGYADRIQTRTINQINSIEELYKKILKDIEIDLEEAKSKQLLESILGCSTEELLQKYNSDPASFNLVVKCIKDASDTFWPWSEKSIEEIATDANEAYISEKTNGSKFGQMWFNLFKSDSLLKELGIDENATLDDKKLAVKAYYEEKYLGDMSKLSEEEKTDRYEKAFTAFGKFLNKYKSAEEKALLAAVIEDLRSTSRGVAVELTLASCMNDKKTVQTVAKSIEDCREAIVSNVDALEEIMTAEDATEIANTTFKNMSEEDANNALNKMQARGQEVNARLNELLTKKEAGTLTVEEQKELAKLSNYLVSGYSGAVTGAVYNENFNQESRKSFYNQITTDTKLLNISKEVVANINEYTNQHPEVLKASSNTIENVVAQMNNNIKTTEEQYTNSATLRTEQQTTKESKEIQKTPTSLSPQSNNTAIDNSPKGSLGFEIKTTPSSTKANLAYKEVAPTLKDKNKPSIPQQEEMTVQTLTEVFNKGYKAFKEYTKNTNDSEMSYLIETLNDCKNTEIVREVLASLENYDDSFLGILAENVKNNDIKKELGSYITNIEVLNNVLKSSNNNSIIDFYKERIEELEEKEQKNNCANDVLMA
ncbi:hypothetical protein IJ384_04000 [bacterium]|nr:hypothetical protein [bacterium]